MSLFNKETLAEKAIQATILKNEEFKVTANQVELGLRKAGAAFVTVYVDDQLRGCMGSIEVHEALYLNIIQNAVNAVTRDFRFLPINKNEIETARLKVEVSVLSPLKRYQPKTVARLLNYLKKNKPGLVIEKRGRKAVFLPQVWQQVANEMDFLNELCHKAGLTENAWRSGMDFYIFTVNK